MMPRDWSKHYMTGCDWLKGSHMTKGSAASEIKLTIHVSKLWHQIFNSIIFSDLASVPHLFLEICTQCIVMHQFYITQETTAKFTILALFY